MKLKSNLLLTVSIIAITLFSAKSADYKSTSSKNDATNSTLVGDSPYIGEITMFGGNFAPRGWAKCDGQLLAISSNSALFSILGTTYGGDGRTTFALPDLRGRAPIHAGRGPGLSQYSLGQRAGNESNHLNIGNLPSHSHSATISGNINIAVSTENGEESTPNMQYLASGNNFYIDSATPNANLSGASHNLTSTIGNTGANQPVNNVQPVLAINYIIAIQGLYPSRN
jgi:microcystin-dependent protein